MQIKKTKNIATLITIMLLIGMSIPLLTLQTADAEVINGINYDDATATAIKAGMHWTGTPYNASATRLLLWNRWQDSIPTFVYVVPSPNPAGIGQQVSFVMFNPQLPYSAATTNDIRYEYSLEIGKPDGTTLTLPSTGEGASAYTQTVTNGHFVSDTTGTAYTLFTPDQVGNYSVTVTFHQLYYKWNSSSTYRDYYGVTLKESHYTINLVVQQDPIEPITWKPVPLPTEFWSRPIEGQNTEWWHVASNWYNNANDRNNGGSENRLQYNGIAPNTGHILWTKPIEDGGLVGGGNFSTVGEVYNAGHQYQTRMDGNTIIMNGKLYYLGPRLYSGEGDIYRAVDLQTGQLIWERNITGTGAPSFGYMYDHDDMNQHGVVNPGFLFTNNFARAYHPLYGDLTSLNITGVPSGLELAGPKGEQLRLVLNSTAGWLAQWNSSEVFIAQNSGNLVGNTPFNYSSLGTNTYWNGTTWVNNTVRQSQGYASMSGPAYDWNVSIPWVVGRTSVSIRAAILGDILLGSNGSHPTGSGSITYNYPDTITMWGVSLKPGEQGKLLWTKNIQTAGFPDNHIMQFRKGAEGVFVMMELPIQRPVGYSMYTGELLWSAVPIAETNPFGYYGYPSLINVYIDKIGYGKYFSSGYSGMVFAFDLKNGTLLWQYEAPTGMSVFKYYTLMPGLVVDGKIFVGTHEHSADTPLFKGAKIRVLDVNTGQEVWSMYGWAYPGTFATADGTLVYWNNYDHQIYAVAKGPTETTVSITNDVVPRGSSVMIKGTVTDISAGTKQKEQAARFPQGVPAVSDASQSGWMEYVYMQKPRPSDTTGVNVTLSVVDSNGNFREIGTTTSNDGFFTLDWKPDIEGLYTVYAAFAGSESYWPSHAITAFNVDPAAPTPTPTAQPLASVADQYFVPAVAGIVIAIFIVGAILALLMLRKRA